MEIKDIKDVLFKIDLIAVVVYMGEVRETKALTGKTNRVTSSIIKDETGDMKLTLWNEQIDQIKSGDKIHIEGGYIKIFNNEVSINVGQTGKIIKIAN